MIAWFKQPLDCQFNPRVWWSLAQLIVMAKVSLLSLDSGHKFITRQIVY